jgi:hypothetical protein
MASHKKPMSFSVSKLANKATVNAMLLIMCTRSSSQAIHSHCPIYDSELEPYHDQSVTRTTDSEIAQHVHLYAFSAR